MTRRRAKRPAPIVGNGPSSMYVRVPLPPRLVELATKYQALGSEILALLSAATSAADGVIEGVERASAEVTRDARKLRRRKR